MTTEIGSVAFAVWTGAVFWFGSRDGERTERRRWLDAIKNGGKIGWKERMDRVVEIVRVDP